MNKLLKGAIAGAAGLTLLMGGAGTFALWNATAVVSGGTITAGTLDIVAGTGTWANGTMNNLDIADYRIVPGDVLTYTQDLTVTATGDNIRAKAVLGSQSITAAGNLEVDRALAAVLTNTGTKVVATVPGTGTDLDTNLDEFIFTANSSKVVNAIVTITFPEGTSDSVNPAKLGSVSVKNVEIALTQVTP